MHCSGRGDKPKLLGNHEHSPQAVSVRKQNNLCLKQNRQTQKKTICDLSVSHTTAPPSPPPPYFSFFTYVRVIVNDVFLYLRFLFFSFLFRLGRWLGVCVYYTAYLAGRTRRQQPAVLRSSSASRSSGLGPATPGRPPTAALLSLVGLFRDLPVRVRSQEFVQFAAPRGTTVDKKMNILITYKCVRYGAYGAACTLRLSFGDHHDLLALLRPLGRVMSYLVLMCIARRVTIKSYKIKSYSKSNRIISNQLINQSMNEEKRGLSQSNQIKSNQPINEVK